MITDVAVARRLRRYGDAWVTGDAAAAIGPCSGDAVYRETPFDPPMVAADAIRRCWTEGAQDGQRDVPFAARPVAVAGDTGCAHRRATFVGVAGEAFVELDGVLAARFDEVGRCREFRQWWHRRESTPPR